MTMEEMKSTKRRWPNWKLWIGVVVASGTGYASFAAHSLYPPTFNIGWDEEVQVTDKDVIWVHRTQLYRRRSTWSRWDSHKVAEELSFTPSLAIGRVKYRIDLGAFGGIERAGDDWVVAYGGTNPNYLHIGSCSMGGHGNCVFVIKPDGTIYKPRNANEVVDNFYPLLRCRTTVDDCHSRFDGKKVTLNVKNEYNRANPAHGDSAHKQFGKPFPPTELTP
jgi:hypothetical protein